MTVLEIWSNNEDEIDPGFGLEPGACLFRWGMRKRTG
jgi:hypothetical protein